MGIKFNANKIAKNFSSKVKRTKSNLDTKRQNEILNLIRNVIIDNISTADINSTEKNILLSGLTVKIENTKDKTIYKVYFENSYRQSVLPDKYNGAYIDVIYNNGWEAKKSIAYDKQNGSFKTTIRKHSPTNFMIYSAMDIVHKLPIEPDSVLLNDIYLDNLPNHMIDTDEMGHLTNLW